MKQDEAVIDRRSDIGGKLSWFLVCLLIAGFATAAWATANKGETKADKALELVNLTSNRVTRLETQFEAINYRLDEIKALVKSIPRQ